MNSKLLFYLSGFAAFSWASLVFPINRNLEYEFFLCLNILFILLAFIAGQIKYLHQTILTQYKQLITFGFLATLSPLVLLLYQQSCSCSPRETLLWLMLLWGPGWLVAWGTFFATYRICQLHLPYFKRFLIQIAFGFSIGVLPLIILWIFPQKRLTGLFWGFLHGPIYDHWIPVDGGIFLSRSIHGLIGLFTVLALRPSREIISRFIWIPGLLATLIINLIPFPFASHGHGSKILRTALPQTHAGNGYELHFAGEDSRKNLHRIDQLTRQIEFNLDDLQEYNTLETPVQIYVYNNQNQKKKVFGGGSTDVTDVVTPSIHITWESWPHATLRHELVHAITSGDAFWGLGFHPNIAFTEGLAMALAPTEGTFSLNESVRTLKEQDQLPPLELLFSPRFWLQSGRRAYRTAGSFIKYLLITYSKEQVMRLYKGESWENIFSVSMQEAIQEWLTTVGKLPKKENNRFGEAIFRYPGIFLDLCPHSKATLGKNGKIFPGWRQPSPWQHRDFVNWLRHLEPQSMRHRFQENFLQIKSAFEKNDIDQVHRIISLFPQKDNIEYLEEFSFKMLAADLHYLLSHDLEAFKQQLNGMKILAKQNFLGFSHERQLDLRIFASLHLSPADLQELVGYLAQLTPYKQLKKNNTWLFSYLHLRRQITYSRAKLTSLWNLPIPSTLSNNIKYEWYKYLGIRMMQNSYYDLATKSFTQALHHSHPGGYEILEMFRREAQWNIAKKQD